MNCGLRKMFTSSIIAASYLKILSNIFSKILIAFCSLTLTSAFYIQMYLFDFFVVTVLHVFSAGGYLVYLQ